jgi:probable F420-dependent oxidoreductase
LSSGAFASALRSGRLISHRVPRAGSVGKKEGRFEVKFGAAMFLTDYSIAPGALGVALEQHRFESFWAPEHTHIPASRTSPWPGGDDLPQFYYDVLDPFIALTAMAQTTTRLRLATGIALVPQHDPFRLAKQSASLDLISGGRFILGVGAGWNVEEMVNHGADPDRRFGLMRERVEAVKELWTKDLAEYHGDLVDFDPVVSSPKPVQRPHPPVHVGGTYPGGMNRAIRYGDGWMPIGGRGIDDFADAAAGFTAACEEAGRDRSSMELTFYLAPPNIGDVQRLADLGVDRCIFGLPPRGADEVLPLLDNLVAVMEGSGLL